MAMFKKFRRVAVKNTPLYRRHPAAGRWQDAADTVSTHLPIALGLFEDELRYDLSQ